MKKSKRRTKSKPKKHPSKIPHKRKKKEQTELQVITPEIVTDEHAGFVGFTTQPKERIEVLALHFMGILQEEIAARMGLARATVSKIINYAPEKNALISAMQYAAQIGLQSIIPDAVRVVGQQIKEGDATLAFALLVNAGILNKRMIEVSAHQEEFEGWTPEELKLYIDTGEKPKGK